jgi:hypothetical protein
MALFHRPSVGGNGCARAQQLLSNHSYFFLQLRELDEKPDDTGRIAFCAVSKFLWQSSLVRHGGKAESKK